MNEEDEFMSTIELVKKIEKLSSEDYDFVISLVDRLSDNTEAKGLRIMSEDDLVAELTESIESSDKGNTRSAQEVSVSMREKYVV